MNLLQDPWMPVRDAQGRREWITPDRLSEPQWQAFDADRPDFNGALAQFAIGLLQTTTPVSGTPAWRALFREPPAATVLRQWFEPLLAAFELDGDGPRFMQDLNLGTEGVTVNSVAALFIDAPGDNTVKNNADHFVKRGHFQCLCPACAALALFTLQLNAPAGGAGHRTGLRGGGPLTTLIMAADGSSLWQHLWLNVTDRQSFLGADAAIPAALDQRTLPWLGPLTQLQPAQGQLAMSQVHAAHHFWATPRRIHLQFEETAADSVTPCSLCGRSAQRFVRQYATKNYGLNYKGEWNHPLSPYYQSKEGWLALHPQPDGLGYRHWLAWVLGVAGERRTTRVAPVVSRATEQLRRQTGPNLRLWAFGYDMDNAKARCWYESTLPIYGLTECDADSVAGVQAEVGRWLSGAEVASSNLRGAVKDAWFGHDARGDYAYVDAAFWATTEVPFYAHLRVLIEAARSDTAPDPLPAREAWHSTLVATALHLFDAVFVGTGPIERQNPRRVAEAHRQLLRNLHGPKIKQALGLPVPVAPEKTTRGRNAKVAAPQSQEPL